jgi:phenylalanyl-tRNA synthetase beta chain
VALGQNTPRSKLARRQLVKGGIHINNRYRKTMKASIKWLKEYVEVTGGAHDLAKVLTMAGVHVAAVHQLPDDWALEFEITSNRNDCLSIIGIAREIGAVTGKKVEIPRELQPGYSLKGTGATAKAINIRENGLCPRYAGRMITDVKVRTSPKWLTEKLISIGSRPVNNIVDVTNFVLFECGQPMHAFDLDKIKGDVCVRKAVRGEKLKTIDGVMRDLDEDMLVIADDTGPIAVAGVMGGADTEVTEFTKHILLESAMFDPISVRRTARKLGISSEASYRFERRVDVSCVLPASQRGAKLILDMAGGQLGELVDVGEWRTESKTLVFVPEKTRDVLGIDIEPLDQQQILERLGFKVVKEGTSFHVTVPTFRRDVSQDVDLIEEIARIYGYEAVPETIPSIIGNTQLLTKNSKLIGEIKSTMAGLGFSEIYSYDLLPAEELSLFSPDEKTRARVINPLSSGQEFMANTLLPGMARAIAWNTSRKNMTLALFEVGKSYKKDGSGYAEAQRLSMAITGPVADGWMTNERAATFYDLKGAVESLFSRLGLGKPGFEYNDKIVYFSVPADIKNGVETVGVIGKLDKDVAGRSGIKETVYMAELYLDRILDSVTMERIFKPIPRFPGVVRDISMAVDETVLGDNIVKCIERSGGILVNSVSLISVYKGEQIPKGKTGLHYRVEYINEQRTLTDQEVESAHNKVKEELAQSLNVTFR